MDVLTSALAVITGQWSAILRLLALSGVGMILTFGLLRCLLPTELDSGDTLLLALAGWPLWWVCSAFLAFFIDRALAFGLAWAPLLAAVFGLFLIRAWKKLPAPFGRPGWGLLALLAAFLFSLFTRLAFLADLLVPAYFDGALHYSITQHLLTDFGVWPWETSPALVQGYYHIGFHLWAALFAEVTKVETAQVILILGQIILAISPFPVFFILRRETKSTLAASLAFLLAGWGWNMPAHALNWGKYPALAGLLALQFTLALAFLFASSRRKIFLGGFVILAALLTGLIHTRFLGVLILFVVAHLAAGWWLKLPKLPKWSAFSLFLVALGALGVYLQSRTALNLVFDPYLRFGIWLTLLVFALSPFAFRRYEKLALTNLLVIILLLACLLLPLPTDSFQTLLDRPLVQMLLYLPLAVLGGLGLAGLRAESFKSWQIVLATVVVFSAVGIHLGRDYVFSPSPCCIQFKADDAVAIDWMKARLTRESHILVAGNVLNVFDIDDPAAWRGSDGGVWITPLTELRTSVMPYGTDFGAEATFTRLCEWGITHVYVGGTRESFSQAELRSRPEWYLWQFSLPGAHLFELTGCP